MVGHAENEGRARFEHTRRLHQNFIQVRDVLEDGIADGGIGSARGAALLKPFGVFAPAGLIPFAPGAIPG